MEVEIYIHGVPHGQCVWHTANDDQIINQFYVASESVQTKFLVEVRKSAGKNYCYYSMLKYKNVSADDGRAGSYFGITIRMDMVCVKIKTMFHILEMIYENDILGNFLKREGERLLYIVGDFKDNESQCKNIVDKIMAMLGNSVGGNDFVSIAPSMLTKGYKKLNVAEYSSESAFAYIRQGGSVAVSADYPPIQWAEKFKKKEEELIAMKQQTAQQIVRAQQQATQEIARAQQQASQQLLDQKQRNEAAIQQVKEKAQCEIQQTKAKYAHVEKREQEYNQKIKQVQKENDELQRRVKQQESELQNINIIQVPSSGYNTPKGRGKKPSFMRTIFGKISKMVHLVNKMVPFVNLLIGIVVLFVLLTLKPADKPNTTGTASNIQTEKKQKQHGTKTNSRNAGNSVNADSI